MATKKLPQTKAAPSALPVVSDLESHLGYWLRLVSNRVSHSFQNKVESRGVLVSDWVLLRHVYGAPDMLASDVAAAMKMTKGAVAKIVARLEEQGLLTRVVSDTDRRQQALKLTSEGSRLVPELARLADQNDDHFFGHLPRRARADLLHAMRELAHRHVIE
jgi:DNA-binding MarR family transcriptional regulator